MTTLRQPPVNAIVRNEETGSETAISCLDVTKRRDGKIEARIAENVYDTLPDKCEVLLINDRGSCWHRFHSS